MPLDEWPVIDAAISKVFEKIIKEQLSRTILDFIQPNRIMT